jgi:hypothetical protein
VKLYTVGYRDPVTDKRRDPEEFYGSLPPEAVTVDIRSHPYSPFAPEYTRKGVECAVQEWKPGNKTFYHVKSLGNTHKDTTGKRITPPIYVDEERGFRELEEILREHGSAVIFCACSYATREMSLYRCHRFYVADEMARRISDLEVMHLDET